MADGTHIEHRYLRRSANRLGISAAEYERRMGDGEKWCCTCKAWHPVGRFGRDRHTFDGMTAECLAAKRLRDEQRQRPRKEPRQRVCSEVTREKMAKAHRGPSNANWKGGVTPAIRRARQHALYQQWRRAVLRRDAKACTVCGCTQELQVHHKQPFKQFPELRLVVDNGVTLCSKHHRDVHAGALYVG